MIGATLYGEIASKLEEGYDNTMQTKYQYCFIENEGQDYEVRFYPCLKQPTFVETDEGKIVNRFNGKEENEK
tara:strand:- start:817 stop:1032 length:216 start_codon:yes stop_codon:yes gene_type:complete